MPCRDRFSGPCEQPCGKELPGLQTRRGSYGAAESEFAVYFSVLRYLRHAIILIEICVGYSNI
jgi:hypothetical protein